jgi:hypothetical protein
MNTNKFLSNALIRRTILQTQVRAFGPKPKAAGGGAPVEAYVAPVIHKTNFE